MITELNKLLTNGELSEAADNVVESIFSKIESKTQEDLNVKAAILKQAFLDEFERAFIVNFLNASEDVSDK